MGYMFRVFGSYPKTVQTYDLFYEHIPN